MVVLVKEPRDKSLKDQLKHKNYVKWVSKEDFDKAYEDMKPEERFAYSSISDLGWYNLIVDNV